MLQNCSKCKLLIGFQFCLNQWKMNKLWMKDLGFSGKIAYDIVKYHLLEVLTFVHLNKNVMNALVKPIPRINFALRPTHQK